MDIATVVKSRNKIVDLSLVTFSVVLMLFLFFGVRAQETDAVRKTKEQEAERKALYGEAVRKLSGVLSEAADISNVINRSNLISTVALLLPREKVELSRAAMNTLLDTLLKDYKALSSIGNRTEEESTRLSELDKAILIALRAFVKLEAKEAERYRIEFYKIKQSDDLKRDSELLMREYAGGLGRDREGSIALITAILRYGIPENFVGLVYGLKEQDPEAAYFLINAALQNLASNPGYTVNDAIILSTIILGDPSTIYPVVPDSSTPNRFGWNTLSAFASPFVVRNESKLRFFSVVFPYLKSKLFSGDTVNISPDKLIKRYFLIEKLRFYSLATGRNWSSPEENFRIQLVGMLGTAGFSEETIFSVSDTARRIVERNNPFRLDDGTKLLDEAEKHDDVKLRDIYLARAVIQLIESGNFPEAERTIGKIDDSKSRRALFDIFVLRIESQFVKSEDYNRLENYALRIESPAVQAFVFLKALEADYAKMETATRLNFIANAEKAIEKIDDKLTKASAMVLLASIILQSDYDLRSALNPVKAINAADGYVGDPFKVAIQVPALGVTYSFTFGKDSFEQFFRGIALRNWSETQLQATQLRPKYTALLAEAYAAAAILKKYSLPGN